MISEQRLMLENKIKQYEKEQKWDYEVQDNPETIVLTPDKIDYLNKKLSSKLKTYIANRLALHYFENQIKKKNLVIKKVVGIENYMQINGGVILTCNHFNPADNYVIDRIVRANFKRGQRLYKVIREGNYTAFPGLFGFLFRHCNTLPLSSNTDTMKLFLKSMKTLLDRGEKILIYPEQSMWLNYKKPRPLKNGAFRFSAKFNVPVVPAFICMEDSDRLDADGCPIQEYTVYFCKPIYPKDQLSDKENQEYMKEENYKAWKEVYESFYKIPLEYEG